MRIDESLSKEGKEADTKSRRYRTSERRDWQRDSNFPKKQERKKKRYLEKNCFSLPPNLKIRPHGFQSPEYGRPALSCEGE